MNYTSQPDSNALQWMDNYYQGVLEHPEMYASSPSALEDVVDALESIRHKILPNNTTRTLNPYQEFLLEKGFGSASFTYRMINEFNNGNLSESRLFTKYATFLHDYLVSQSRLPTADKPRDSL